jgi:RNase P subunit RPR2
MANIFTLENFTDFSEKINIDELYEKKRQLDLNKLELFKKILNRIHVRIKTTSKQNVNDKCCWFVIPEIIIGVPKYDQSGCIAYIMDTLQTNGFQVKYFHPNTIFISWDHWVPSYVRNEIKKKTGIIINEYGERLEDDKQIEMLDDNDTALHLGLGVTQQIKNSKKFTPINSYKPSGKLVYSEDLLNKIEDRIN